MIGQRLISAAAFLRATAVGAVGVFLAIALTERGLSLGAIGFVIGAGMAGGAVATALVGARIDQRVGRRRFLVILALLGAAGLAVMAAPLPAAALVVAAFLGMVNGMGRDRGGLARSSRRSCPTRRRPSGGRGRSRTTTSRSTSATAWARSPGRRRRCSSRGWR